MSGVAGYYGIGVGVIVVLLLLFGEEVG